VVINLFNFFRHYKSPPFHTVIRIHLISLSCPILVILPFHFSSMEQMLMLMLMLLWTQNSGANIGQTGNATAFLLVYKPSTPISLNNAPFSQCEQSMWSSQNWNHHVLLFANNSGTAASLETVPRWRRAKIDIGRLYSRLFSSCRPAIAALFVVAYMGTAVTAMATPRQIAQ